MGELTTIELRTLASHPRGTTPDQIRQALQWAADRIDHLEGFIESYEAEEARQREGRAFNIRNDNTHSGGGS
jgi:hypothetical protein